MGLKQKIATVLIKTALTIGRVKSHDLDISTPYGNYFFQLTNSLLEKYMSNVWTKYSDSALINLYHGIPEVYAAVHQRAFRVAQGKFVVRKVANKEIVDNNKDLNRLLSKPNPLQNWQDLVYEMEAYKSVTGKNFLYANAPDLLSFNYKNVARLWNLFADTVTIKTNPVIKLLSATTIEDIIKSYDTEAMSIPPHKVMYTQFCSLYANDKKIIGKSPLASAEMAIDNIKAVYKARNVVYTKGGALGFISSDKSDADGSVSLTPAEKEEANKYYTDTYGLDGKKSAVGVVGAPIKFTKIGANIQELQPFEETEASASAIYAVLNVPRSLMPRKEGATYENAKQDEISFYQNIIIPEAISLAQSLTNFLRLNEAGFYIDVTFDHIQVLQENKKEKAEVEKANTDAWHKQFFSGVITLNDWRLKLGLEKMTGNKIYDLLIYDMDEAQLKLVELAAKFIKGGSSGNNNQNNTDVNSNP